MSLPARSVRRGSQTTEGPQWRDRRGKSGIRYGVVVDISGTRSGANLGLVGSDERVFEVTLTPDEAKRLAYALLLAADGIKPLA